MKHINSLIHPPKLGETYLVPCVFYQDSWVAVLTPSHEDSKYLLNANADILHHWHGDPRFDARWNGGRHFTISKMPGMVVENKPMVCFREMPKWGSPLYRAFGKDFIDDMKDKEIKCNRCPHKGVYLGSIAMGEDWTIECPAHGLKFDYATKKCAFNDFELGDDYLNDRRTKT